MRLKRLLKKLLTHIIIREAWELALRCFSLWMIFVTDFKRLDLCYRFQLPQSLSLMAVSSLSFGD
ncbi:hypothetical protein VCSRO159_3593 [Vibrio cholerae]|nr:hypothetical protein VCSRO159_3593 [Vibrio cholerae]